MPVDAVEILHDVFISYARKDADKGAAPLDAALKPVCKVWRDVRGIAPEKDFTAEIEQAIKAAARVVVCVTQDVERDDSFVRREIAYANLLNKPILVARFEDVIPPIHVVTHTWVDFFKGWDSAIERVMRWLKSEAILTSAPAVAPTAPDHPLRPYVERVYKSANNHLQSAIIKLIDLDIAETPDAVPSQIDMFDMLFADARSERPFTTFAEAFATFDQRTLLLGEPGAGKSVTLMATARQAAADWLADSQRHPLPLLGVIATWDSSTQPPLADWLGGQKGVPLDAVRAVMADGKALLLLDGLDELGDQRTERRKDPATGMEIEERYDPRQRFIAALNTQLGANKVLVTCRIVDYDAIGDQVRLDGAVTLQELTDTQMQTYLAGEELAPLLAAMEEDEHLREMARTPLLLSYLAFAFLDRPEALRDLKDLREGALRDAIFNAYIDQRYAREERRLAKQGKTPPFTLEFIRETLGRLAMENAARKHLSKIRLKIFGDPTYVENLLNPRDFKSILPKEEVEIFIAFCISLHLISKRSDGLSFIHIKLRDTLAYIYSIQSAYNDDYYSNMHLHNPSIAIANIGDDRAFDFLLSILENRKASVRVRRFAIDGLGILGDSRALMPLVSALESEHLDIQNRAAQALADLNDVRCINPLIDLLDRAGPSIYRYSSAQNALLSLGLNNSQSVELLLKALEHKNPIIRSIVAEPLGAIGDKVALEPLIRLLEDPVDYVISSAASALGFLGDTRAIEPLSKLLNNDTAEFGLSPSYRASRALMRIGTPEALAAVKAWREQQRGAQPE